MSRSESFDAGRVGRLREVTEKVYVETALGPIEEELLGVVCDRCGDVQELNMDRLGLDWPDVLEGWCTVEGVGDLCPRCKESRYGGDDVS